MKSKVIQSEFETEDDAKLADRLQKVEHPTLSPEVAKAQVAQLRAATISQPKAQKHSTGKWLLAFGGTAAVVGVLIFALVAGLFGNVKQVQAARLGNIDGIVEVTSDIGNTWTIAAEDTTIKAGDGLRTYTGSNVLLTFQDGSVVQVGEDAEFYISRLEYQDGILNMIMLQIAGETNHWVIPIKEGGQYRVNTLTGSAQVHGTVFNVNVPEVGLARFAVTDGLVAVSNAGDEVLLTPGKTTSIGLDGSLIAAAFDFSLQGILESQGTDGVWVVNGVSFLVTDDTTIKDTLVVGDSIHVVGRVLESGERVADLIMLSKLDKEVLCFSGEVESIGDTEWIVSGQAVAINTDTVVGADIAVGSQVEVRFTVQEDGSWLALAISSFDEPKGPPENKPTKEPREPKGPKGTLAGTGEPVREMEGTPGPIKEQGICELDAVQPEAVKLAERYNVTYEEIMTMFCLNYGFGEIDLAYGMSLETGIPVAEIFAMKESGMSWGQIKQTLLPNGKPNPNPNPTPNPQSGKDPNPTPNPNPYKGKN